MEQKPVSYGGFYNIVFKLWEEDGIFRVLQFCAL